MPQAHTPPELDPATLSRLRALLAARGERGVRAALDLPRSTLARAAAGLPIRRATAEVIRIRLDRLQAERATAGGSR